MLYEIAYRDSLGGIGRISNYRKKYVDYYNSLLSNSLSSFNSIAPSGGTVQGSDLVQ